jgi:Beta-lactamase superfamily domain
MHLHFLGTRGEIEMRTRQHRMHSALLVSHRTGRVMIDCGLDWLRKLRRLRPDAIVLTHAHPDHAWGLKNGAPCPVFAPEQTWQTLKGCRVDDCRVLPLRKPERICGVAFEAFAVEHSLLAPAVGYRVSAGRASFFYAPDVVFIHERAAALREVQLYIGDGATVSRSFVSAASVSSVTRQCAPSSAGARKSACHERSLRIAAPRLSPAMNANWPRKSPRWHANSESRRGSPATE